nr:uncharacterized protein LOC123766425 [Procambarus clarkii]
MERLLRPERFATDPNATNAAQEWRHWLKTFQNFTLAVEENTPTVDKLRLLINYVAPRVFDYIADCTTYDAAEKSLTELFVKPKNEVFARQRLLENKTLDLQSAFDQARTLETAQKLSASYAQPGATNAAMALSLDLEDLGGQESVEEKVDTVSAATTSGLKCFFCGYSRHPRSRCPAREALFMNCKKKGHYAKVCRSLKQTNSASNTHSAAVLATLAGTSPSCLNKSVLSSKINGIPVNALIDIGSSENFIHKNIAEQSGLLIYPDNGAVSMATVSFSSKFLGQCSVDLELQGETYHGVNLKVLPDLCADVILGHNFLQNHSVLEMAFGGDRPPLRICGLAAVKVPALSLFSNLAPDCKPIAVKSRRYSEADKLFIKSETARMLREKIIRPSHSPWRAQVLVTKGDITRKEWL